MKRHLIVLSLIVLNAVAFARTPKAKGEDTGCTVFPCVVASVTLTDQTAPLSNVVLVTPTSDALYRITYYLEPTTTNSFWNLALNWTDEVRSREWVTAAGLNIQNVISYSALVILARQVAGQPLTYSTEQRRAGSYSLFITVEQVQ